jgi:hypothetical protein
MEKRQLTAEEIYKKNQKKSKVLRILSPIVFWGCLVIAILCLIFAIRNSFGNVAEICTLLESDNYTGEQLQTNYNYLIEKYGEWTIGTGSNGFQITFVNVGEALFSGVMIVNIVLSVIFFVSAYVLGKWLLPKISAQILLDNQDMVNMTILKTQKNKE